MTTTFPEDPARETRPEDAAAVSANSTPEPTPPPPAPPPPALEATLDGRVAAEVDGKRISLTVRPCFPFTHPREFLSLRDDDGNEKFFINNLNTLDHTSRSAVDKALEAIRFTFEITRVAAVEKDFELRVWKVETEQGPRTFVQKLDDWPQTLDDGSLVLRDLQGDLYRITDPDNLDKESRKKVWAYQD